MLLFCPHCDDVIEVLGEPRGLICDCGGELEVIADFAPLRAMRKALDGAVEA